MTTDLDTRITTALGTIADAATANRDTMLSQILLEGSQPMPTRRIGPFRPVTLAAGALAVSAAIVAVAVITVRESPVAPAADKLAPAPAQTNTTVPVVSPANVYTVITGDSLMTIAQSYCVTIDELVTGNGWVDGVDHRIFPGDSLLIPASGCRPVTGTIPAESASSQTTVIDPSIFNPDHIESQLHYVTVPGDTAASLAYQLCTSVTVLAGRNEWPDGLEHVLADGDLVAIPIGSCIKGTSLKSGLSGSASPGPITMLGDSEASRVGEALSATGLEISDLSKDSSGLARPDYYDWPNTIDSLLPTLPAGSTVVMVIGGNDGQMLLPADAQSTGLQPETAEWFAEYMSRVQTVANKIVTAGHPLIWVGVHGALAGGLNQRMVNVSDATDYALEEVPGVLYITAWDVLRGPDGASPSETVLAKDGTVITVFNVEGGPLTAAAIELLSQRVATALHIEAPVDG